MKRNSPKKQIVKEKVKAPVQRPPQILEPVPLEAEIKSDTVATQYLDATSPNVSQRDDREIQLAPIQKSESAQVSIQLNLNSSQNIVTVKNGNTKTITTRLNNISGDVKVPITASKSQKTVKSPKQVSTTAMPLNEPSVNEEAKLSQQKESSTVLPQEIERTQFHMKVRDDTEQAQNQQLLPTDSNMQENIQQYTADYMANLNQEQGRQPFADIDDDQTNEMVSNIDDRTTPDHMMISANNTLGNSTRPHFTIQDQGEVSHTHTRMSPIDARAHTVDNVNSVKNSNVDDDYSPRSKLEELSRSYMGNSKIIKPSEVDFNSTVMKLSDNDERLREEVTKALKVQKEVFQQKINTYEAVARNFDILKKLSLKQQQEYKAAMKLTEDTQTKNAVLLKELTEIKGVYGTANDELTLLKKKEKFFAQAIEEKLKMELQINDLQCLVNKKTVLADNLTATNRMLEADNSVAKDEIVALETEIQLATVKLESIESRLGIQNNLLADMEQTCTDQSREIERKGNRIIVLDSKCQQQVIEIQDQEERIVEIHTVKTRLEQEIVELTETRDKLKSKVKKLDKKLLITRNTGGDMAKAYEILQVEYTAYQTTMKDKYEQAQLEIAHHEGNFYKVQKELKTLESRFEMEVSKSMDNIQASNEERGQLREQIAEGKEENLALVKQINEIKLIQQRSEIDSKIALEQMEQEKDAYILELKGDIAGMQRQISDLTIDFSNTKEMYDQKAADFSDLRSKVDGIIHDKVKFESEAKKATEAFEKSRDKQMKLQETNKRLEANIEGEVKNRVVEIVAQKDKALQEADEVNNKYIDLEQNNDKLRKQIQDKIVVNEDLQEDIKERKKQHEKLENKMAFAEKRIKQVQAQSDQKLDELDKLYFENDKLNNSLAELRSKFDLEQAEKDKQMLEAFDAWSNTAMSVLGEVPRTIETYFACNLCNALAVDVLVCEPCGHVFCKKCFENQVRQTRCNTCHCEIENSHVCILAIEFLEGVSVLTNDIEKVTSKFKYVRGRGQ